LRRGLRGLPLDMLSTRRLCRALRAMDTLIELFTAGSVRDREKDIRLKIANIVANTARSINAVVVLEKLPKQCPRNMVRDVKDPVLRHRIY